MTVIVNVVYLREVVLPAGCGIEPLSAAGRMHSFI